jgi:hypothetical protein
MRAIIDGYVITYACGFSSQQSIFSVNWQQEEEYNSKDFAYKKDANTFAKEVDGEIVKTVVAEPVAFALSNVKRMVQNIMDRVGGSTCKIYLTGKGNFREQLVDDYKANRPPGKPVHYQAIRDYMISRLGAEVIEGQEADDAMSIDQMSCQDNTLPSIICTIDKDLIGTPGFHYNWNWDTICDVSSHEALIFFYFQLMKGDAVDNIAGLYKQTGKKLTKDIIFGLLDCEYEEDMWEYVRNIYGKEFPVDKLITTGRLLYMRRYDDEDWEPPPDESEL